MTGRAAVRQRSSPLARKLALERGIALSAVTGSGPAGRIRARDLEQRRDFEVVSMQGRRTIAARLTEAWQAPAFQLSIRIDVTRLLAERDSTAAGSIRPTLTDLLLTAVARALVEHPELNATFDGEELRRYRDVQLGLAVAGARGLVVPVIRSANRLSLPDLVAERVRLVEAARGGTTAARDLEGGTFTVSNLGMYGIRTFTAVLNPPQVAILAVGAVHEELQLHDGAPVAVPMLELTLTCDHRALDGDTAARFLQTLQAQVARR